MKQTKTHVLLIHGGMTFQTQEDYLHYLKTRPIDLEWSESWTGKYLSESLWEDFEIIKPRMPGKENAKYEEWKIHFERYLPLINDNGILIWNSLGGIFLAKYLSENRISKRILWVYLVCPPFDNSLGWEDLCGWFELWNDASLIWENCKNIKLLFSDDDDIVPIWHAQKYQKFIPQGKMLTYTDKNGHFFVSEFPEIVEMIVADRKELSLS